MPFAADSVDRHRRQGDSIASNIAAVVDDLLPLGGAQNTAVIRAGRILSKTLSPAWPELQFGPGRIHACLTSARPQRLALAFRPGTLRLRTAPPDAWASSTIAYAWKGGLRRPGLGERLLTQVGAAEARGESVAATIVAEQLGGVPSPAARGVEQAMHEAIVLVESERGGEDEAAFGRLLLAHAAAKITVLARHPRTILAQRARRAGAAVLCYDDVPAWPAIQAAAAIHAPMDDDFAILARLARRPVFVGGTPVPESPPSLLAAAHLVLGSRYIDPANGAPITCEAFLDRLMAWRRLDRRVPPIACFAGISFWKRRRMAEFAGQPARFARSSGQAVAIARAARKTQADAGIAVWPSRAPRGLAAAAAAAGIPVFRIEDGFIRSRGLGADFIPPASVIIDQCGIYYDAREPSDLEILLNEHVFAPDLLHRARRLRDSLVARRITKYNLGGTRRAMAFPAGRRRILVPGQVADDLSVRTGGGAIAPGLMLLAEVRRRNPDAFIVYKPHPDVEAGHRPGAVPDSQLHAFADAVVRDADMGSLIEAVDEVHTVTSLTGFEALLRHRSVTTYGRPFYAGWGLTTDIDPPSRRGRRLSLDELVAATLILYPHYIDPVTRMRCGPEQLIERLDQAAGGRTGILVGLRRTQGAVRRHLSRRMMRAA